MRATPSFLLLLLAVSAGRAQAPDAARLDGIDVRAARLEGVPPFELPASLTLLGLDPERNRADASLSESLGAVPGVQARERQNLAQDTQLSIRGFGARASFGVRGLRLYADGIPASLPDGQGQLSHFALAAGDRVEVLRGPFSVLHGQASGGVVQLWSADGGASERRARATLGSHGARSASLRLLGGDARLGWNLAAAALDSEGFRAHSAAQRRSLNGKLHLDPSADTRIELVVNGFDAPDAQDPLGLTRAQARADPRQAIAGATQFDTRKSVTQAQLGARLEHRFGAGLGLHLVSWRGQREVEQFLALPVAAQANPLSAGGVIDLDGRYDGVDARLSWRGRLAGGEAEAAIGLAHERQRQQRRGFENFLGDRLGVRGALRRDEHNRVHARDPYAQLWWRVAPRWSLLAGVRRSDVRFRAEDDFVTAANPDDSGTVRYARTSPVLGASFAARPSLRLYAAHGRGFETPTFNELGYRADGGAGLAFDLRPARSRHHELGAKWRADHGVELEAAGFRVDSDDELAVARNVAGRSSFRNVGRTRRAGVELSAQLPLREGLTATLALTRLDARFRDGFPICTGAGCSTPNQVVDAGTRLPGTARDQLFARLDWRPDPWQIAVETAAVGEVGVDDARSESAPGHALLHLEVARAWPRRSGRWRSFLRVDNALDKAHIGSVIVNEGNRRFYEPGPGRTLLLGVQWETGG